MRRNRETGLACPNCQSSDLRVVQTASSPGSVVRRRKCNNCGHNMCTQETLCADNSLYNEWNKKRQRQYDRERTRQSNRPIERLRPQPTEWWGALK